MSEFFNKTLFAKLFSKAKFIARRDEEAGYDLFPRFEENHIVIHPNSFAAVHTRIKAVFPKNVAGHLKERGSLGALNIGLRGGDQNGSTDRG